MPEFTSMAEKSFPNKSIIWKLNTSVLGLVTSSYLAKTLYLALIFCFIIQKKVIRVDVKNAK